MSEHVAQIFSFRVLNWYHRGNMIEMWKGQCAMVSSVAKFMSESKEENWMLPVMNTAVLELRLQSISADAESAKKGATKPGELLEKSADSIMACFRVCATDTWVECCHVVLWLSWALAWVHHIPHLYDHRRALNLQLSKHHLFTRQKLSHWAESVNFFCMLFTKKTEAKIFFELP